VKGKHHTSGNFKQLLLAIIRGNKTWRNTTEIDFPDWLYMTTWHWHKLSNIYKTLKHSSSQDYSTWSSLFYWCLRHSYVAYILFWRWAMTGWNSIVKMRNDFLNTMQKFRLKTPYRYWEIVKTEMTSFSYDVNDHVYSKLKLSNFVRINCSQS